MRENAESLVGKEAMEGFRKWQEQKKMEADIAIKDRKWLFEKIAEQMGLLYVNNVGYIDDDETDSVDDPECAKRIIWEKLSDINNSYKWDAVFQLIYNLNLSTFDSATHSLLMKYRNFYGDDNQFKNLLKGGYFSVEDALIMSVKISLLTICPSDVEFYETHSDEFRYLDEFIILLLALEKLNRIQESHKGGIFEDSQVKEVMEAIGE